MIISEPIIIQPAPKAVFRLTDSPPKTAENIMASTTLSLSTGTT